MLLSPSTGQRPATGYVLSRQGKNAADRSTNHPAVTPLVTKSGKTSSAGVVITHALLSQPSSYDPSQIFGWRDVTDFGRDATCT